MIKNHRLFLKEPNDVVSIRNDIGQEVSFHSLADFHRYTGVNIPSDIIHVDYEPKLSLYHVEWEDPDNPSIPLPPPSWFENHISNIPAYLAAKDDPFHEVTLEEAKDIKQGQFANLARAAKRKEYTQGANKLSPDGLQDMEELLMGALLAKASGDSGYTVDVILKNTNPDGTNKIVTLTADQVISFVKDIKDRNESYNQIAQAKIDEVQLLTTVEDIKNFPISDTIFN